MVIGWGVDRSTSAIIVILFICLEKSWSETVYMDRYGDCFHGGPMEVDDESYKIMAQGGDAYDTLTCEMTFKSLKNDRLCLSFTSFHIRKCDVKLSVYSEKSASGNAMGTYTCHTGGVPDMVCSDGKYLTVLMKKQELSHEGYDFVMMLREYSQTDAFADGIDAYIVSISVIVGIIVAVIVVVILTAVVIVCCCCKNRQFNTPYRQKSSASSRTAYTDVPVQPTEKREKKRYNTIAADPI
ncbi:uncharacterized protein LOC123528933 [Mercenaria mercenaria]|uniref:uncharacterized protein LOC123528933 n=1 Tax=Mercenaria mercenaria TaxID=6596 RepID=UPI00234E3F7F|nr:uncharacterized protein LOC123528933 [Mercenaria mercenaria]